MFIITILAVWFLQGRYNTNDQFVKLLKKSVPLIANQSQMIIDMSNRRETLMDINKLSFAFVLRHRMSDVQAFEG
jgi:hypothetical protein